MRRVSWISDSGDVVVFDANGPFYLKELASDLGASAETTKAPRQDGVSTWHAALETRTINLTGSMWIFGDRLHAARAEYDRQRSRLCQAFAPNRWGTLLYHREDTDVQVRCRPLATPTISPPTGTFSALDISFTADSPYWEGAEEVVEALGVIRREWHFPWSPRRAPMGSFSPFAAGRNPTAVDIYPAIEVYSTCQHVTLSNLDTGESVTIQHAIEADQKLAVDMRDVTAILWERDESGVFREKEDVSHWMSLDSTPWCIRPGGNRIQIRNEAPEDTPVAYLRYRIPYLGV